MTTIDEFFDALAKIKDRYLWSLDFGQIRGYKKEEPAEPPQCPITAVYAEVATLLTGTEVKASFLHAVDAAHSLGLDRYLADQIMESADNKLRHYRDSYRVRQRMIDLLGLRVQH